jgi:hypothetical protein
LTIERRHGGGPNDAVVVMILLNGGRDDARNTNAVTTHDHRLVATLLIKHRGIH